jgi:hypothetical protein
MLWTTELLWSKGLTQIDTNENNDLSEDLLIWVVKTKSKLREIYLLQVSLYTKG